ncbi:MAG: hypothetical protein AABZ08_05050 [Planctomycetota bacterium]
MAAKRNSLMSVIATVVVILFADSSYAQFGKKKNSAGSCLIRPDAPRSPLGVSFGGNAGGVRPATPTFASPNPFIGTRILNFGSRLSGSGFGRSSCNPRPTNCAPTFNNYYNDSSPWNYPSNNLGHCNSGTFYTNRSLSFSSGPVYTVQPQSVFIPSTLPPPPPISTPGWNTSGARLPGTDRAISVALDDFKRNRINANEPTPPQAPRPLSDADMKELEGLLDKGDDHFSRGRYAEARDEYTRAIVVGGDDPGVRIPFGMSEFALGRFADASRAMRQAATAQPPFDPDTIDVRQAYERLGEFDAHVRGLEQHVAAHPFDPDGLFLLGFIKACSGNATGARAVFENYLALRDADPATRPFIDRVGTAN